MKKTLGLILLFAAATYSYAQPWVGQNNGHIKYNDVVAQYQRVPVDEKEKEERGGKEREDENYQFDRWCWYWKQHLDTNGYIVRSGKNAQEWATFRTGTVASKTSATDNWIFQGPKTSNSGYSGLGRVNTIAFDPVDSNTIYVGSAGGGTWKTTDGGSTWSCLYDIMGTLAVSDIKVNPLNRNTLYVTTGDADGTSEYSVGVIKSYDGGATWINIGPTWTVDSFKQARSFLINPADTNKLMLGTSSGLYKSSNGGASWTRVAMYDFRQVIYCPHDTAIVYATKEGYGGGSSAQIMRSMDGGYTWSIVTSFTDARRINLAVVPSADHIVKAIVANFNYGLKGIYSSGDYGATYTGTLVDDPSCSHNLLSYDLWLPTTACNGQGYYDLCIAIDPTDLNKVIIGGINNYYSIDGGFNWTIANRWNGGGPTDLEIVHADKHWLGYNPLTGGIYLGCDGGIYKNYSPLTGAWTDLTNGIGITQFYRNAVDNGVAFCLGGAQDNGSKMIDGTTYSDLTGGDGTQCLINYEDPANIFYCGFQNGYVDRTTNGGVSFESITDDLPTPGAWITPYVQHPVTSGTLFIGYKEVFASYDYGSSWGSISPQFSTTKNIEFLAIAPSNPNYIYAVRDADGSSRSKIHFTTNLGTSWDTLPVPLASYIYVSDIVVDPLDPQHIWITASGYNATQKVYSYNGTTWTNESAGLPNMPVNCMVVDTFSKTRYIGTDATVFYKTTAMTAWAPYSSHLPSVNITDLNINHTTSEIWAATYGRGMWKSKKNETTPVPPAKVGAYSLQSGQITLSPNPCHDAFTITTEWLPFRNATANVRLVTVDGKTALTSTGTFDTAGRLKVNTNGLPAGLYFCEVTNEKGIARGKIVVN